MLPSRRVMASMLLAGALLATAACSSDDKAVATRPTGTPTPAGPTLLTFAVYGPPQVITAYTKIAADFSAAHPDTVVNVRPYDNRQQAEAALAAERKAGDPPDAFLAGLDQLPMLVNQKAVRRIDDLLGARHVDFGDGFQRDALEAFSSDNALQCMPVDVSPMVVYVNTDLVSLAGLTAPGEQHITPESGWTVDQFAAAAAQASRRGVRGVYVAPELEQIAPFVWSGGGQLVDDLKQPTTLTLADDPSSAALEKLLEVVRNPQLTFSQAQLARRSALQRFKTDSLAMMLGYRDLTPQLRDQENLRFDVMPLPRVGAKATIGQASGLCLSSASKNTEKTADFLAYAVSNDAEALLAATGYVVPTNLDVVNSDAFLQPDEMPASASVFSDTVRSIHFMPRVPVWPSVEAGIDPLLVGLFYDPVVDPLADRLKAIDAASAPLFTPIPTSSPTPGGPGTTPSTTPGSPTSSPTG